MIPSPPGTAPAEQPSASLMWNRTPSSRARRTADGGCPNIVRIQIPCGAREVRDFHMRHVKFFPDAHIDSCQYRERKPRLTRDLREANCGSAPIPVTCLWMACTRLKRHVLTSAYFPLTGKTEGVQQDRSLTAS